MNVVDQLAEALLPAARAEMSELLDVVMPDDLRPCELLAFVAMLRAVRNRMLPLSTAN